MTFWDAGEFIAAAHGLGIPHPPGTPLYVALGHVWSGLLAPVVGVAVAMNLMSAVATAAAAGLTTWMLAREGAAGSAGVWGAVSGACCAGLMASAWANATETEVYAVALVHVALMLACAARAGDEHNGERWVLATAYAILLAPAVHLSALVAAPAAITLAARRRDGAWRGDRVLLLAGALVSAAGIGRMSTVLLALGGVTIVAAALRRRNRRPHAAAPAVVTIGLVVVAASALLIMLIRARHDPAMNQGNPSTLAALADVVARRQYDVAPLLPRRAPLWLQLANVAQYVDWQVAIGLGHGIFTTPARVVAAVAYLLLAAAGARALRRESRRLADALLLLLVCGTIGVAGYLNLRAGASLGWGVIPDSVPHEARERDYFFVLGFWAWGCLAGHGALAIARARRWPAWTAVGAALVPLFGNWAALDRSREPEASSAARVARAFLASAPRHAVLFLGGDNDSYPLWYAQQVAGTRRDVTLVTLPLLSADWYAAEIARRTALRWRSDSAVAGTRWRHEQQAALIADAARRAGRPVAASPLVTPRERTLLGADWRLTGNLYVAGAPADPAHEGPSPPAGIDVGFTPPWTPAPGSGGRAREQSVDPAAARMLRLLECPRLARPWTGSPRERDSLEVSCNLR